MLKMLKMLMLLKKKSKVFLKAVLMLWNSKYTVRWGRGNSKLFVERSDDIVFSNVVKVNFISRGETQEGKRGCVTYYIILILIVTLIDWQYTCFTSTKICTVKTVILTTKLKPTMDKSKMKKKKSPTKKTNPSCYKCPGNPAESNQTVIMGNLADRAAFDHTSGLASRPSATGRAIITVPHLDATSGSEHIFRDLNMNSEKEKTMDLWTSLFECIFIQHVIYSDGK